MKTHTKHINGKDYLYAYDEIFIAKGKRILKNKSLGPVASLTDVTQKQQKFLEFIVKEEKILRTKYWSERIKSPRFMKYIAISKIESARTGLYRSKMTMGPFSTSAMETAFLVDFIYNSNKIEGSKIPRENVEKQVREGATKNNEVGNTLKALYHLNNQFKFTLKGIKELHDILLAHEPKKLGFRKERVIVGNSDMASEVADWKEVEVRLKALIDWFTKANKTWYPPELAFTFYYRFERIHPFIDGNGRVGRLIMNKILKDHRYHPMIIWNKRRTAHLNAFESFVKGKEEKFFKFMSEQFVKTHEIYTQKIQRAFDLEKQFQYFLEPSEYSLS